MTTNLNHHDWIAQQFQGRYLQKWYRNVLIHASIIEGILIKESCMDTFDTANRCLRKCGNINPHEYQAFNEIRKIRNKIAHGIFKGGGFSQRDVDELRDDLMDKIRYAYQISIFLEDKLFKKYSLRRPIVITYKPKK